jgi:5-methylcytosine-specific restriction protein B
MHATAPDTLHGAEQYVSEAWQTIYGHVEEVFFGNTRALAEVLKAESDSSPYGYEQEMFAGQSVSRITKPDKLNGADLYNLLRAIAVE